MHRSWGRRELLGAMAATVAVPRIAGWATATPTAAPSSSLPSASATTDVLRRVHDQWIGAVPHLGEAGWSQATCADGILAYHRLTGDPRARSYVESWAEAAQYQLLGGPTTRHADAQCAGQVYLGLHDLEPEPAKVAAIVESVMGMSKGVGATRIDDWWWVDALHMAMPAFAGVAAHLVDDAPLSSARKRFEHTRTSRRLFARTSSLWYRDAGAFPGRSPNGLPILWLRGNGWAMAAMTKTLDRTLPEVRTWWSPIGASSRAYTTTVQAMAPALRRRQRADGFWSANLGDARHHPHPETSGTALLTGALAWGVRSGLLTPLLYRPVVARAWNGLVATAVHPDGRLGYVQGVAAGPSAHQPISPDATSDFGVGAFLWAGTEVARLAASGR